MSRVGGWGGEGRGPPPFSIRPPLPAFPFGGDKASHSTISSQAFKCKFLEEFNLTMCVST